MHLPFISLSRFDEMLREKNIQIGYRDRRIAELEAERRILWDKICLLGIGETVFGGSADPAIGRPGDLETAKENSESQSSSYSSSKGQATGHLLPSMIMRRMDRLAEARWQRRVQPAKTAERQRDEVMNELNAAHMDAVRAGAKSG